MQSGYRRSGEAAHQGVGKARLAGEAEQRRKRQGQASRQGNTVEGQARQHSQGAGKANKMVQLWQEGWC